MVLQQKKMTQKSIFVSFLNFIPATGFSCSLVSHDNPKLILYNHSLLLVCMYYVAHGKITLGLHHNYGPPLPYN